MTLRTANIVLGVVLVVFAGLIVLYALDFRDPRTGQMPLVLAGFLGLTGAILIVLNAVPRTGKVMEQERPFAQVPWGRWTTVSGFLVLFGVGAVTIGFYESAFLFITGVSMFLWRDKQSVPRVLLVCAVFGLVSTAFLYLAFSILLRIPIPDGVLI